ncbi:MAG: hypothetical protein HQL12_06795 [Candidatus Omnitrophica bacterium]|nr:hypothetical protein [Candidatus Omnitrophota bacterium]
MNPFLLLSGLFSLTLFVISYFHPSLNPTGLGSDGNEYWHLAANLFRHHTFAYTSPKYFIPFHPDLLVGFTEPSVMPCTFRLPGYPYILSLLLHIWHSPYIAIILNYLAYAGICIYGFLLSNMFFPNRLLNRLYNFFLVFSPLYFVRWGIGSELLAGFLITGFTYHFLKSIANSPKAYTHLFIASLWGFLANFTRGNLIIYTVSFILIALSAGILRKEKGVLTKSMIILCVFFFSSGAWMYRNYKLTDQWTISTQGGYVLHRVNLGHDYTTSNTLYFNLFIKTLQTGKTFNQTEAIVDQELKNIVLAAYKKNPMEFFKKTLDGIRTFFLFSYYDISDAITLMPKPLTQRLEFVRSSSSECKNNGRLKQGLFQISRCYKWVILISFFSFPVILLSKWPLKNIIRSPIFLLYLPTLLSVIITAIFTGAAGDRMRLPFNAPILIFVVLSWGCSFKKINI